jgi:MoaA/NifB/PqqE/SkfB family radical SAM enzyme
MEINKIDNINQTLKQYTDTIFEIITNKYLLSDKYYNSQKLAIINALKTFSQASICKRDSFSEKYGFAPQGYVLTITDKCNLCCKYCYSNSGANETSAIQDYDIDIIINEMKNIFGIYFVTISGGEPFPDILDIARRHGDITFFVYTNGTMIDERVAKDIKSIGNIIPSISLIGKREYHDKIRGINNYNRVINTINILNRLDIIWGASITASNVNIDSILHENLINDIVSVGAHFIRMIPFIPVGRQYSEIKTISDKESKILGDVIKKLRDNNGIIIHDYIDDNSTGISCMAGGRRYFHITSKTNISPCVFMDIGKPVRINRTEKSTNITDILINDPIFINTRRLQDNCNGCIILKNNNWKTCLCKQIGDVYDKRVECFNNI